MKKLFSLMLAFTMAMTMISVSTQAQIVTSTTSTETLTNADTIYISFGTVGDGVKSIQAVMTKLTGTAAGKAYLEVNNDRTNWVKIDSSAAFTDITTNTHIFAPTGQYLQYRIMIRTSGTVTASGSAILVRRKL